MLGLSRIQLVLVGGLLAVVLTAGAIAFVYDRGERAGSGAVTTAVQTQTIQALDKARTTKEKADEDVQRTPYGDRADGLR